MIETMLNLNHVLAFLGLIGIVVSLFLFYDIRAQKFLPKAIPVWGLWVALMATLGSIILTLIYSEYFGIQPCGLCWLGRIALYPQVPIIAVALFYKDTFMPRYGITLSIFGLVVSLYHHYIQMGGAEFVKCPTAGGDCAKRFFFEYEFMTFPLLSAILFAFLILLYIYILKTGNSSNSFRLAD